MAYNWVKALHFVGLALLLGGPAFWYVVGRTDADGARRGPSGAGGWIVFGCGFIVFVLSGYLDVVRAATDLWGELLPGDIGHFLREARFGQIVVKRIVLAASFATVAALRPRLLWAKMVLLLLGLAIVYHVSIAAHSAANGPFALLADIVHVAALGVWGGGLVHFAASLWPTAGGPALAHSARRFATVCIVSVSVLIASGAYMATQLIHSPVALTGTPYGGALLRKIGLLGVLSLVAAVNHFYLVPALQNPDVRARFVRPFRVAVGTEVVLLLLILVATGVLTTNSPPKEPQALPGPLHRSGVIGDGVHYELHLTPSPAGNLVFDLHLHDGAGRPLSVPPPFMDLTMPTHLMPPYHATLARIGAGHYRTDLVLPMSGFWRIFIETEGEAGPHEDIVIEFRAAASPRDKQREWYVSHWRATRLTRNGWPIGPLASVLWLGLACLAVWAMRRSGGPRRYKPLFVASCLLLIMSTWQVVSLFVAKGYPTQFQPNPVPRTEAVIARGRDLFVENCAVCHGDGAKGDGPLRDEMWPPPSDLTIHVPWHPDGELFWFISKGVDGTDMPAFEHVLTDDERWTITNYLRTLPGEGAAALWFPGQRYW